MRIARGRRTSSKTLKNAFTAISASTKKGPRPCGLVFLKILFLKINFLFGNKAARPGSLAGLVLCVNRAKQRGAVSAAALTRSRRNLFRILGCPWRPECANVAFRAAPGPSLKRSKCTRPQVSAFFYSSGDVFACLPGSNSLAASCAQPDICLMRASLEESRCLNDTRMKYADWKPFKKKSDVNAIVRVRSHMHSCDHLDICAHVYVHACIHSDVAGAVGKYKPKKVPTMLDEKIVTLCT